MSSVPMRKSFQPGDGIAREVISADIQRYLGPDATVRPGQDPEGNEGYWITAYKRLTTSQVADLKQDSERWLNERTAGRDNYQTSATRQSRQARGPSEPVARPSHDYPSPHTAPSSYTYAQPAEQAQYQYPTTAGYQQQYAAGYAQPRAQQYAYTQQPAAAAYAQPQTDPRYYTQAQSPQAPSPYTAQQQQQPSSQAYYSDGRPYQQAAYSQHQQQQYQPAYSPPQPYSQYQQPPPSSRTGGRR